MELTDSGKSSPPPPMLPYPTTLNCDEVRAPGGEPSRDSVLPSLPLVCSKKPPQPPRMAILPSPLGSQAKPMRGAGLKRWPDKQPAFEDGPTVAAEKPGTTKVPPLPPHWIMPLSGLPVPGERAPALPVTVPAVSITGEAPPTKALGSKLKA